MGLSTAFTISLRPGEMVHIKRGDDAGMVESEKEALIFTTNFRLRINSEICCWRSESECTGISLCHSFYLPSFTGQAKTQQMKVFRATVMIDCFLETVFWTVELALTLVVSCYHLQCPLVIWSYLIPPR